MPTLYHAPLTCSLAARIAAAEGDVALDLAPLHLGTKTLASGGSLSDVNPLGQVSVLALDDGSVLTETMAIIAWINARSTKPGFRIDPSHADYFQMLRWLSFCATELHKGLFRVVFYDEVTDAVKDRVRALTPAKFEVLERQLTGRAYVLGDSFTAADAYLAWFFTLSGHAQVDHTPFPNLTSYRARVLDRPAVRTLVAEDEAMNISLRQNLFTA